MSTPHISAEKGAFAKTVLMPGDPLRAKFIAEHYLREPKLINEVRGMYAYTGTYHDTPVSVMASGMGMPSIGIYSYELFSFYDVEAIIRVGTAGAVSETVGLRDIVLGMSSATNSAFAEQYRLPGLVPPTADFSLLQKAYAAAQRLGQTVHTGVIYSTDCFYDDADSLKQWRKLGILAVEMESAALYLNAARLGKKALCICTISDCPLTGASCSSMERESGFTDMMELALETAVSS